jgi:putative ABC transport system permease protein
MYTFVDQSDLNRYSKKGEQTVLKNIKVDIRGSKKSFLVQGIVPKSDFFKMPNSEDLKENEVLIGPSLLTKFNLHVGDTLILIDDLEKKEYPVVIKDLAAYDYGQYLYTNIKTFNHIFNIHKQSYNALVTNQPIDISEEKLSSVLNKKEMVSGVQNLLTMVNIMAGILLVGATLIFVTVIYMLMKMIIDKSKINISMVKIFGYTPDEVSNMYLNGNFIILILGFLLALPAGYMITKMLYDSIMTNMQQYILPYIKPFSVLSAFIIMTLSYMGTCFLLKRNLNRVLLTEALKNRE